MFFGELTSSVTILGMVWELLKDEYTVYNMLTDNSTSSQLEGVLAMAAKINDPLGFKAQCTMQTK